MSRNYRLDYGTLGEAAKTTQGGYAIPAALTRAGVFTYISPDGRQIREWRPSSEVFRADTLKTLQNAPFTVGHPRGGVVKAENYSRLSRGHIGSDVRQDGDKTAATVFAQDQEAIRAIEKGQRQISCGYHCDTENTAGVVPDGEPDAGQRYDRIQRNIVYNHAALVPNGRAGGEVRLRLDADGDSTLGEVMDKVETIGGIEYPSGTPAAIDARARLDAADKALKDELATLRADGAKLKAERDAAVAAHTKLVAEVKEQLSAERLDAAVRNRVEVLEVAKKHLGADFKADGKDNWAVKLEVLKKVHPDGNIAETLRQDAVDANYVAALWDAACALPASKQQPRNDSLDRLRKTLTTPPIAPPVRNARLDAMNYEEERHTQPLSLSSRKTGGALQRAQMENMK